MIKNMIAVRESDGTTVQVGDMIPDFRDGLWRFDGVAVAPSDGKTGRVAVSQECQECDHYWHHDRREHRDFYPSVFDLKIVPAPESTCYISESSDDGRPEVVHEGAYVGACATCARLHEELVEQLNAAPRM